MFSRYANKESRTWSNGNTKPILSDRNDVPKLEMCWRNCVLKVPRLHLNEFGSPCTRLDVINIHSSKVWTEIFVFIRRTVSCRPNCLVFHQVVWIIEVLEGSLRHFVYIAQTIQTTKISIRHRQCGYILHYELDVQVYELTKENENGVTTLKYSTHKDSWTEHCASPHIDQNIYMEDKLLMSENMNGLTYFKATTIQVQEPEPSQSLLVFPKQIEDKLKVSLKELRNCNTYGYTTTKDAANFEDTLHEKVFSMIGKFFLSKGIYPFHDKNQPVSAVNEGTADDIQHGAVTSIIKENLVVRDCSCIIETEKFIQLKTNDNDAANFEDTLHEIEFSLMDFYVLWKERQDSFHDKNPTVSEVKEGTAGDIQHGAVTSIIKENLVMYDCSWVIKALKFIQLKTNDTTNIGVNVNENCAIAHDIQLAVNGNDYSGGPADTTANTTEISFNCYKKRVSESCMQPKTKYVIRQSYILVYIKGTSGYTQQFETFCATIQTPYHGFYCFGETCVESVIHAKAEINLLLKKTDHELRCTFQQPVTIKILSSKITEQMADQQTPAPHIDGGECVRANSPRVEPADSVPLTDVDIPHDLCDVRQTCQFNHLTNVMMLMCMVLNIISVRVNQDMSNHKHMATEKEGDRHTPLSTKMIHQRQSMPKNKKWKHKKKQHFELASNASFLTALCIGSFLKRGFFKEPCVLVMTILAMTLMASGHPVRHMHHSRGKISHSETIVSGFKNLIECSPTISKGTYCNEELGGFIFLECEISACNDDFTLKFEKKSVHNKWKPAFYYVNNTHYKALHSDTGYDLENRTQYKAYPSKHTLHINPLYLEDQGDWRCVVYNSDSSKFKSNKLKVNIHGTHTYENVYITPNKQHLVSGQSANFTCTFRGIYSEPIVIWNVNGAEQSHGKAAIKQSEDGLWNLTNTITLEFEKAGHYRLSCVMKNKYPLLTGHASIDVKDPPMIREPHETIAIMTDLTVQFTLNCTGFGYTPHITWKKDGKVILRNDKRYHIEQTCNATVCQGNLSSTMDNPCLHPGAFAGHYKCGISLGAPYQSTTYSPDMYVTIMETACKENHVGKTIGLAVLIVMVIFVTAVIFVIREKNRNVCCI